MISCAFMTPMFGLGAAAAWSVPGALRGDLSIGYSLKGDVCHSAPHGIPLCCKDSVSFCLPASPAPRSAIFALHPFFLADATWAVPGAHEGELHCGRPMSFQAYAPTSTLDQTTIVLSIIVPSTHVVHNACTCSPTTYASNLVVTDAARTVLGAHAGELHRGQAA